MLNNLLISVNAVLPLFIYLVLGWILRKIRLFDEPVLAKLNRICFRVFLPFSLFRSTARTDLKTDFNGPLVLFALTALILLFILLMLIVPRLIAENPRRSVVIQGIYRSNLALYGLPLATSLVGEAMVGPTALLVGIGTPVFNVLAVICLEAFRGGKPGLKKILKGIVTNPLIIACAAGILVSVSGLTLPAAVDKAVGSVGGIATPLSLMVMGGGFAFSKVSANVRTLIPTLIVKLVAVPAGVVAAAAAFGFRNEYLIPVFIMFAAPTAVSSYSMAAEMGGDAELASEIVVFTTLFSLITIFLMIFILKQLSLF